MTDLTMSQFASKDDLLAAQAARIAELEADLEAVGAGGVEPLRKCNKLHQIAEPAAPVGKPIKDAIDALVMAAFTEGGCSEHRMSEARIQTELRKKELRTLLSTPQPCSRSHPHEEMTPMCELRTEIARLTNALARAEAQLAASQQGVQPKGEWTREVVQGSVVIRHPYGDSYEFPISTLAGYFAHPTQQGLDALDAARYRWLRERDLETVHKGGVFAGMTPENYVINGVDLDAAIDAAIAAQAKQGGAA